MLRRFLVTLSVVVAIGAASAQDIVLENLASVPCKQWVDVALPATDAASLPRLCRFDPHGWIAYKGRAVGQHSVMFHVLGDFGAQQRVTGQLTPVSNSAASLPGWGMTGWVADGTVDVIPRPVVLDANGVEHRLMDASFEIVESESPARRVFRLSGRLGTSPLVFEAFLYVYVGQDTVELECSFACSHPRMAHLMSYGFVALWFESGEHLHLDYRDRLGLPDPFVQNTAPTHPSFGRWVQLLSGPRMIGRGEGLHVQGAIACMPLPSTPQHGLWYGTHGLTMQWTAADRVSGLQARLDKPVVGVWQHWEDKWLAFGMVPEVPIPHQHDGGVSDSNASWAAFLQLLQQPADMFVQRPRGLLRSASSTGAQEDFGACKGAYAVTVGDPRWIFDAGYSVAEAMMRGFHYREVDGSPMLAVNHPQLQCFNQLVNCRTTGDMLGYPCPLPFTWPSTGWATWDDQHRSQNNFNAMLALTGRFALVAQLRDLAEVDKAMVPNWMDSPRAEGRLTMAWANMLLLLEDPADRQALLQTMLQRIQTVLNNWPGAQFVGNPQKPIRVLEVGSDPTFLEPGTQDRVDAVITWEHSIAAMGFYAAWRVTGDSRYHDMAKDVSRLVVDHCCFQENGQWIAATAIRYLDGAQEGDALPASSYYTGSPDVHVSLNFWPWVLPAVLVCRELHAGNNPARVARCDAILLDVAPNGPSDWLTAEWWAVLPR